MPINYPGPYAFELFYIVTGLQHTFNVNCAAVGSPTPGTSLTTIDLQTIGGSTVKADTAISTLWGHIRPIFNTGVTVAGVNFWKYPTPGSKARIFISALSASLPAGSSGGATNPSHGLTMSFRTALGGILKLELLETVNTQQTITTLAANAAGTAYERIAAYAISTAGWMLAADDSFPIAPYHLSGGQDEATFKARNR